MRICYLTCRCFEYFLNKNKKSKKNNKFEYRILLWAYSIFYSLTN